MLRVTGREHARARVGGRLQVRGERALRQRLGPAGDRLTCWFEYQVPRDSDAVHSLDKNPATIVKLAPATHERRLKRAQIPPLAMVFLACARRA